MASSVVSGLVLQEVQTDQEALPNFVTGEGIPWHMECVALHKRGPATSLLKVFLYSAPSGEGLH